MRGSEPNPLKIDKEIKLISRDDRCRHKAGSVIIECYSTTRGSITPDITNFVSDGSADSNDDRCRYITGLTIECDSVKRSVTSDETNFVSVRSAELNSYSRREVDLDVEVELLGCKSIGISTSDNSAHPEFSSSQGIDAVGKCTLVREEHIDGISTEFLLGDKGIIDSGNMGHTGMRRAVPLRKIGLY